MALQEHQQLAEEKAVEPKGEEGQQACQTLARELATQRAACEAWLQGRQAVVEAKAAELRARDAEYVRAVEQHAWDVDALLAKMRGDSAAMQARYEVRV